MPIQINVTITLPDNRRSEQFAHKLSAALDRKPQPDVPAVTLGFTDPELWDAWKQCSPERVELGLAFGALSAGTSKRDYLLTLVDQTVQMGYVADASQLKELCAAIGLAQHHGALRAAIGVMVSRRNKAVYTRFPGVELTKIGVDWNNDAYSLTQLKHVVELDNFGTIYLGFRGGSPGRLKLIREFVHGLVQAGLFDDPA